MEYERWMRGRFVRIHHMAYYENPGKLGVSKRFDYELRETLIRNKIFLDMLAPDSLPLLDDLQNQLTKNGEMETVHRLSMDAPFVFVIEIADGEGREVRIRTPRILIKEQAKALKIQVQRYLYLNRPWSRVGGRLHRGGRLHGRHLFDIVRIIKKCERRWVLGYQFETPIMNRNAHSSRLFVEGPEDCHHVFMHETMQEEPKLQEEL